MDAPREVFALESLNGKIWVHSTKGPLVFVKLEDAKAALHANNNRLEKKWSVLTAAMTPELNSAPFRGYEEQKSDLMTMPANSIYLADLRDQVALAANTEKLVIDAKDMSRVEPAGDLEKLGGVPTRMTPEEEYTDLRTKLKALGVNVRAIRKLPRLRAMLAEAEAAVEEAVTV